jgi:cell wall assembly regulator SMI1
MKNKQLFENIIDWQIQNKNLKGKFLADPIKSEMVAEIEGLLNEKFPEDLLEIYRHTNGQDLKSNYRIFLGLTLMNNTEILNQLKFANSLIKTNFKPTPNSEPLVKKIVEFYKRNAPKHSMFGLKKSWVKIEAQCGIGSYGGPYLYKEEGTTKKERTPIRIQDYSEIKETIKELHEIENNSWDELSLIIFSNGKFIINRNNFDFGNPKSNPKEAIKEIYFHNKWIPFISDEGGNYIGYDLDPGKNGKKGQIIIYGRDEPQNVVIGNSLTEFLTKISNDLLFNDGKYLITQYHLFENLKRMN